MKIGFVLILLLEQYLAFSYTERFSHERGLPKKPALCHSTAVDRAQFGARLG